MLVPLPYSDSVETIPADEPEDIERLIAVLQQQLARTQASTGEFQRDVHVKSNGCAHGEFQVLPNLAGELAQGIFEYARSYQANIRFSNSAPQRQPDAFPDGRGLAIQVLNVDGDPLPTSPAPVQNLVMVNHPTFVVRNVKEYLRLHESRLASGALAAAGSLLTQGEWNPLHWSWQGALAVAAVAVQPAAHPASFTYYSMVPFRFGKWIAKFRVRPAGDISGFSLEMAASVLTQADAMRLALAESLQQRDVAFSVEVQLWTSESTMPIEDATVEWPEAESPYQPVARLVLPRQDIGSASALKIEETTFNVWHGLASHRPLGGINRVRRRAYEVSSIWRLTKQM